jgi:hypothetical protein
MDVLDYIRAHLAPKEVERQKYGEVFTPLELVDEMLATLPKHVWHDATLRWLDPANGMGTFPIQVLLGQDKGPHTYPGLLKGLEHVIPDAKKRCQHIVESMLYMVDINPKNNAIAKRLFGRLCPHATPNIYRLDKNEGFLAPSASFPGVEAFDIIMGNPPFNRGGISRPDTRKQKTQAVETVKRETIWDRFVEKSHAWLRPGGYLLFLHPVGWFHPGDYDSVRNILLTHQLHVVRTFKHDSQAVKHFSGSGKITVAYYLMEKRKPTKPTRVIGTQGGVETLSLDQRSYLLLNHSSLFQKMMATGMHLWKSNPDFKHKGVPCVPGPHKQIVGIYEDGTIRITGTRDKHVDADKPKLVVSGNKYPRMFLDKGTYGLTGSTIHYWVGDHLQKIEAFLKTKLAALLTRELRYRQDFVEFKYFPDLTQLPLSTLTDKGLSTLFGFSEEEEHILKEVPYPERTYRIVEVPCGGQSQTRRTRHTRR